MADTWATDLLDEEGGDQPMRNGFETELRKLLADTWIRRGSSPTRPTRRLRWPMVAAALLAVAGVSTALVLRLNRGPSHVSFQPPAVTIAAVTTSVPPGSVPSAAVGPLWVVTSVAGVELAQSILPWFRVARDGGVDGYDGCNWYSVRPGAEGIESTAAACVPGIVPHVVRGPFSVDTPAELHIGDVIAEAFTVNGGAHAPRLIGEWQTPSGATTVRFTDEGLDLNDCVNVRTWTFSESLTVSGGNENQLSGCLTKEGQQADGRFVEQLAGGVVNLDFRVDGSLWVSTQTLVSRLVLRSATSADSIEARVIVNADTATLSGTTIYSHPIANTHPWMGAVTPSGRVFLSQGLGSTAQEIVGGEAVPTDLVVRDAVYAGADERLYVDDLGSHELRAYRESIAGTWVLDDSVPLPDSCAVVSEPGYFGCGEARLPINPPANASTVEFGTDLHLSVSHGAKSTGWQVVLDTSPGEIVCVSDPCVRSYFRFRDDGVVWTPSVDMPSPDGTISRQLVAVVRPDHRVAAAWLDETANVIGVHGQDVYAVSYVPAPDGSAGVALKRYRLPDISTTTAACPTPPSMRATYLPPGFTDDLQPGSGGQITVDPTTGAVTPVEPVDNSVVHYLAEPGTFIDIQHGAYPIAIGTQPEPTEHVLGRPAQAGQVEDGYAIAFTVDDTPCGAFTLLGYGVSDVELSKIAAGLTLS